MNEFSLGLCMGRHEISEITDYIFTDKLNPVDFRAMELIAYEYLTVHKVRYLKLYITGLTAAAFAVHNVCHVHNIPLTLMHYNRETGEYLPQMID